MSMDGGGCASTEPFALRVVGDSMAPEFRDGAIIIIDPAGVVEDGSYVLALYEGEYIFRQLLIEEGRYFLKALGAGYQVLELPGPESVHGVVTQRAGKRRGDHKHYG